MGKGLSSYGGGRIWCEVAKGRPDSGGAKVDGTVESLEVERGLEYSVRYGVAGYWI